MKKRAIFYIQKVYSENLLTKCEKNQYTNSLIRKNIMICLIQKDCEKNINFCSVFPQNTLVFLLQNDKINPPAEIIA